MNLDGFLQDTEWSETIVNKGKVRYGTKIIHTFRYQGSQQIAKIIPMCDCIKSSVSDNDYTFWFIAKKPNKGTDSYITKKMIQIRYVDHTRQYLIIKAKITNET